MNKYLTLCIFIIFVSCSSNKQINNHKELVILGAVHFPTDNVNADSIVSILERVSPDCILMEVDSSIFKADFTFKKTFDENEFNAALKYKEKYPNVKLRPIEFEGRNQYRKLKGLYSGAGPTFRILNELNRANEFNKKEQEIWERFTNFYEEVENIGTKNLKTINSSITDEIVDSLKLYHCLLYTSPSPRDATLSRMPSSA